MSSRQALRPVADFDADRNGAPCAFATKLGAGNCSRDSRHAGRRMAMEADDDYSGAEKRRTAMEELNGRMIACQILITGLIAKVANDSKNPLTFLTGFRDEILAVVRQVRIAGALDTERVREIAERTVDELFSLMKPPSTD